jgi:hypothetical protein
MALETSLWIPTIREQLLPEGSFMRASTDESAFVQHKTVVRPQAGGFPSVLLDARGTLTAINRDDNSNNYEIHDFRTTPTVVEDIEAIEVSYDKMRSVVSAHSAVLNLKMANWLLYEWSPTVASNIIRTSGATRVAQTPSATGNRKSLTLEDFFKAKQLFDDMDLPEEGRNVLLPSFMYTDLLLANKSELLSMDKTGEARFGSGTVMELLGFRIFKRGRRNLLGYTNATTPQPINPFSNDYNGTANANAAALFWHELAVAHAMSDVKVYENNDDAEWQGTKISARVRAGGQKTFSDQTGVLAVVEASAT